MALATSVVLAPDLASAQSGVRRIGVLMQFREDVPEVAAWIGAFREELQKLGWDEGHNLRSDYRWGGTDSANDASSNPAQSTTGWSGPYNSGTTVSTYTVTSVPEPASLGLLAAAALPLLRRRRAR